MNDGDGPTLEQIHLAAIEREFNVEILAIRRFAIQRKSMEISQFSITQAR